jgi:hypothetical protein
LIDRRYDWKNISATVKRVVRSYGDMIGRRWETRAEYWQVGDIDVVPLAVALS